MFKKIIGIGIFSAVIYGITKVKGLKSASDKLSIEISSVKWNGFSSGGLDFDFGIRLLNPTSTKLTVNYLFTDILLPSGKRITQITKANWNQVIAPENVTNVIIPVKLSFADLIPLGFTIINLFKAGKMPDSLRFKGYIKVNNISVDFDETTKVI